VREQKARRKGGWKEERIRGEERGKNEKEEGGTEVKTDERYPSVKTRGEV